MTDIPLQQQQGPQGPTWTKMKPIQHGDPYRTVPEGAQFTDGPRRNTESQQG